MSTREPNRVVEIMASTLPLSYEELIDLHHLIVDRLEYLDHRTKIYRRFKCDAGQFIERFTQHIPEKGFRLIRYYGFLAKWVQCWIPHR